MDEDDDLPFPKHPPKPVAGKKAKAKPAAKKEEIVLPTGEASIPEERPPADDEDDDDSEIKLGQPLSAFTPDELSYIEEREADIMNQLGLANRGSARPLVDEVIICDIEIRRLDVEMAKARRKSKDMAKLSTDLKPLKAERKEFMDRMLEAMKNLGIMPKDYIQTDTAASCMTDLWSKYRKELDSRRREGWKIGQLGPEGKKLCEEIGSVPENYSSPRALSDEARDEVMAKSDSEIPRP